MTRAEFPVHDSAPPKAAAREVSASGVARRLDGCPSLAGWDILFKVVLPAAALASPLANLVLDSLILLLDDWAKTGPPSAERRSAFTATSHRCSPRSRTRRREGLVEGFLTTAAACGALWLERGGTILETPLPGGEWRSDRFAVVRATCRRLVREDPAAFVGDKRGRAEELLSSLLAGDKLGEVAFAKKNNFLYEHWWYDPPGAGSSTVPFVASRLGLPARGALVPIDPFLDKKLRDDFNNPELAEAPSEPSPVGFLQATEQQWRCAARRMVRAGLATTIAHDSCDPSQSAGAFAVTKSKGEDRLVCDRRPRNHLERQVRPPLLPYAPRLRRMRLRAGEVAAAYTKDQRHCFHVFGVAASRLAKQTVGPRLPVSWFNHLDDESKDMGGEPLRAHWWAEDLRRGGPRRQAPARGYVQLAICGVVMGDINAVTAILHASRRILLQSGGVRPDELLMPGMELPRRRLADI